MVLNIIDILNSLQELNMKLLKMKQTYSTLADLI